MTDRASSATPEIEEALVVRRSSEEPSLLVEGPLCRIMRIGEKGRDG
jgi:hypothetical protein